MVYLTRKAEFAASHYYHNPAFTPEENQRVFGKCNNPNGHGHNYTLEVTVKGKVDRNTGFVVDLKKLKETMNREVLDAMDHRFLNKEVPEFADENSHHGKPGHRHLAASVHETTSCQTTSRACLRKPRPIRRFLRRSMKAHLTRRYMFSASHRLHSAQYQTRRTAILMASATIRMATGTTTCLRSR